MNKWIWIGGGAAALVGFYLYENYQASAAAAAAAAQAPAQPATPALPANGGTDINAPGGPDGSSDYGASGPSPGSIMMVQPPLQLPMQRPPQHLPLWQGLSPAQRALFLRRRQAQLHGLGRHRARHMRQMRQAQAQAQGGGGGFYQGDFSDPADGWGDGDWSAAVYDAAPF